MRSGKGLLAVILGILLLFCFAMGAMAEEVEVREGVFHGYDGDALDRGVYHTDYPEISDFKIAEAGTTVKPGDTIHIQLKAGTADQVDIDYVNFEIGWNRNNYQNLNMKKNEETGYYEGEYTFRKTDRPGEWYGVYASVRDKYGFYTSYSSNSKRVMKRLLPGSVTLQNEDYARIFKAIVFEEEGKELSPGDKLHVSFDFLKNAEINHVNINFYRVGGGSSKYLYYYPQENEWNTSSGDWRYDPETGMVTCEYTLQETDYNGQYYLGYIYVYNKGNESYRASGLSSSDHRFTLKGAADAQGEEGEAKRYIRITDITCSEDGKTLVDGDTVHVEFNVDTDGEVSSANAHLTYFDADDYSYGSGVNTYISKSIDVEAKPVEGKAGRYRAEYVLQEDDLYGVYTVEAEANVRYQEGEDEDSSWDNEWKTESSEQMFLFDEKATKELKRLEAATDLNWSDDGYMRFTLPEDHEGHVQVRLHREGQGLREWVNSTRWSSLSKEDREYFQRYGVGLLRDMYDDPESGNYYFSVVVLGDGVNDFDSVAVKSGLFKYTRPDRQLGKVTEFKWDKENKTALVKTDESIPVYEESEDGYSSDNYWVSVEWYFAENETDTPERCSWTSGGWKEEEDDFFHSTVPDNMLMEYGSGYYFFKARLRTGNALKYRSGEWSEMSDGCYIGADEQGDSTVTKLDEVETEGKTTEEIRAQVQQIETQDLKEALLTDESVQDKLKELEVAAGAVTQVEATADAPQIASGVTTVGAGLNTLNGETPKLVIDKPKQDDVLPAQYDNSVAVRFSMELENVESPDNLKVPVLIDLPVPENIVPAYLVVLHYHGTTNQPERIHPYVYQAGNKWYAQFALTRFSDFILTQESVSYENALVLPAGLKEIEAEAFSGVGAEVIVVPEGCVSIGSRAFSDCPNLIQVVVPSSVSRIADDALEGSEQATIIR